MKGKKLATAILTALLVTAQTSSAISIVNAQEVKEEKITTWEYKDSNVIDNTMTFKDQSYTKDEVISKLPSSITANENQTVALTWDCEEYPNTKVEEGQYIFTATLEEGYTIDEEIKIEVQLEKSITTNIVEDTQKIETLPSKSIAQKTVGESEILIDETNFPDAEFRKYITETFDRDNNGSLSEEEINRVTEMRISDKKAILSVKGIEYFTALQDLICSNTGITEIDISKNIKLKYLWLAPSQIDELDVTQNTLLEELFVCNTNITELDISQNKELVTLNCSKTAITEIDVSQNTLLKEIYCGETNITNLDISHNTALEILYCDNLKMSEINTSYNTKLKTLYCYNTKITSLDLSNNKDLSYLNCTYSKVTSLDVSQNINLKTLWCSRSPITELNVSQNVNLESLECHNTYITSLDVSHNKNLRRLDCRFTSKLIALNLGNNTVEKFSLLKDDRERDIALTVENNILLDSFNIRDVCPTIELTKIKNVNGPSNIKYDQQTGKFTGCVDGNKIIYDYDCGSVNDVEQTLHVTLTITNAVSTITPMDPNLDLNKIYDGEKINISKSDFTVQGSKGNIQLSYYKYNEKGKYFLSFNGVPKDVGRYQLKATVYQDSLYQEASIIIDFIISPKPISITWDNDVLTYNGQIQSPTATANDLIAGDSCEIITSSGEKDVGEGYTANAESANNNYVIKDECKTTTFNIDPKLVSVTWDNTSLIYNSEPQKPTATINSRDLISGDTCNISVTGEQTNVGKDYTATAILENNNYVINDAYKTTNFVIAPVKLTIEGLIAIPRQYDGTTNVTLTGGSLIGIINSEDVAIVMPKSGTIDSANIGKHNVSIIQPELQGNDKGNYYLEVSSITVNITPLPVQLSWSNSNLIYTGSQQKITATVVNRIGEDVINLTYNNNQATDIGDHTATVIGLDNQNYTLDEADITKNWSIQYYDTDAVATLKGEKKNNSHWYTGEVTIIAPEGYEISSDGSNWGNTLTGYSTNGQNIAGYSLKEKSTGYITEQKTIEFDIDTLAPTGEIEIKQNIFTQFLKDITFGYFFKDNATVTITGSDNDSGIAKIEYQKVTKESHYNENGHWDQYENPFTLKANDKSVIYARITDNAGNITIINSQGIVVYTDSTQKTSMMVYVKTTTDDITAQVNLKGNTINSIKNGNHELRKDTDYTVDDQGNITFKYLYLDNLQEGEYDLTVSYDPLGETYVEDDTHGNQAPLTTGIKLIVFKHEQEKLTFNDLDSQYTYGDHPCISVAGGTGNGAVAYSSSDETVATIDNSGNITIHKAGTFIVTATKEGNENYNDKTISQKVTVNKKELTVEGLTAVDRAYNGSTQVSLTGGQMTGTVNDDEVIVNIPAAGTVEDKNVGKDKEVTIEEIILPEEYQDRYTLKQPENITVDISPKQVDIKNAEVKDKVYDGMNQAVIKTTGDTSDFVKGDDVSIIEGTCTFDDVNAGTDVSVSASGYSLSGDDRDNYVINSVSVQPANITKAPLHVSVKDITIDKGQAISRLEVTVSGFINGEDEGSLEGFTKPTASVDGQYDTKNTELNTVQVKYEGGEPTNNYEFVYNDHANIKINTVSIKDSDYSANNELTKWVNEDIIITPENGYTKISTDGIQWKDTLTLSEEGNNKVTIYLQKDDGTLTEGKEISYQIDKTLPSGEISIKDNIFKEFIKTVTFGVFCKDSVDVEISGTDSLSGIRTIEYQKVSSTDKYDPDGTWISGNSFTALDNEKFIIYAKITDNAGNVMVINSQNVIVYTDSVQATKSVGYEKLSKSDKDIFVELNGNTIKDVSLNGKQIDKSDYSIEGNKITLKGDYLETLPVGNTEFTVSYNALGNEFNDNDKGDQPNDTTFTVEVIKKTLSADDFNVILPIDVIYDTKEHPVTVQLEDEIKGAGDISIHYFKDEKEIEGVPTEAGTYTICIDITEGDYCKEGQISSENWKYTISKAVPGYDVPEGLEAIYGQKLKDIKLPEGYTWKDPELSVGDAGKHTFEVIYTPEDTNNYQVIEGINVNVTVNKAESKIKITNKLDKVYDGKSAVEPVVEKSGSTGNVIVQYYDSKGHELNKAPVNAGVYKVVVKVAEDKNHNGAETKQDFTITKATPTVTGPENINAVHGTLLKDVTLSDDWYWVEPETEVIADVDKYKARINVDDENYDYSNIEGYNSEGHYVERMIDILVSAEENRWLDELSIDSWTYGEKANTPNAKAYKGEIEYGYSTTKDGKYTDVVPVNAGTYYVKATVKATDEYTGLESIQKFEIKKAKPSVSLKEIEITYGDKISLPKGYDIQEDTHDLSAGKHIIHVTYTPDDTDNYEIIKDIKLTVIVKPKEVEQIPVIEDGDNLVIKDGDKVLVEGEDFEVYVKGAYVHIVFKGNYEGELVRYIGEKKDDKKVKTSDETSIIGYALLTILTAGMTLTLKKRKED